MNLRKLKPSKAQFGKINNSTYFIGCMISRNNLISTVPNIQQVTNKILATRIQCLHAHILSHIWPFILLNTLFKASLSFQKLFPNPDIPFPTLSVWQTSSHIFWLPLSIVRHFFLCINNIHCTFLPLLRVFTLHCIQLFICLPPLLDSSS